MITEFLIAICCSRRVHDVVDRRVGDRALTLCAKSSLVSPAECVPVSTVDTMMTRIAIGTTALHSPVLLRIGVHRASAEWSAAVRSRMLSIGTDRSVLR